MIDEQILKDNQEFINKYTPEQWVNIAKELYINYLIFCNDERKEEILNAKKVTIQYNKNGIESIEIFIPSNEPYGEVKIIIDCFSIIFKTYEGHDKYKDSNKIPIYTFRILNKII